MRFHQVFRPSEPARGGFYRYIRIDFLSHYGTEYYCPVSILKVYGLNQLDAYRRDQERDARLAEAGMSEGLLEGAEDDIGAVSFDSVSSPHSDKTVFLEVVESAAPLTESSFSTSETPDLTSREVTEVALSILSAITPEITTSVSRTQPATVAFEAGASSALLPTSANALTSARQSVREATVESLTSKGTDGQSGSEEGDLATSSPVADPSARTSPSSVGASAASAPTTPATTTTTPPPSLAATKTGSAKDTPGGPAVKVSLASGPASAVPTKPGQSHNPSRASSAFSPDKGAMSLSISTEGTTRATAKSETTAPSVVYRTVPTPASQAHQQAKRNDTRPPPQIVYTHGSNPQPNESIYGTIMKRLMSLEVNSTLSTAYIEEQSKIVWTALRRIDDKLGGIEKSVSANYRRCPFRGIRTLMQLGIPRSVYSRTSYFVASC